MGNYSVKNLDVLDSAEPFDVCVIGSGPAGTTVAKRLVESGFRTLMLESGTSLYSWLFDSKTKRLADFEVSGSANYPVHHTRGVLLGGTSNFWTGRCERFHPSDFKRHPYTPKGNPWPISYSDLDPYYEQAETLLKVRGGPRSRYGPPRNMEFPVRSKLDISYLQELFGAVGVSVDSSPTATPSRNIRFFNVQREILPSFRTASNFVLVTGVTVTRLISDAKKRITGAEVKTFSGECKSARAKVYVVCAGGIGTPTLLLRSCSEQSPNGIGNYHDRVGRGFNEHPAVNFYAQVPHTPKTVYPNNKIGRSHQFYDRFRAEGLGAVLPVFRQSWVLPHHNMDLKLSKIPRNIMSVAGRLVRATLYIGAVIEMKISDSNRVMLSKTRKDNFGLPLAHVHMSYSDEDLKLLDRSRELVSELYRKVGAEKAYEAEVTFSRHHQGACRMGDNPATSVVDANLRIHESPNLFLSGCEVFVTGGAMQPVTTTVALANRLGDYLTQELGSGNLQESVAMRRVGSL